MSKSETTAGPWLLHDPGPIDGMPPHYVENASGEAIALVVWGNQMTRGTHEANARLIAAAPVLLDAIKGLIDFIEIDSLPINGDALQIARAAIAKAEEKTGG